MANETEPVAILRELMAARDAYNTAPWNAQANQLGPLQSRIHKAEAAARAALAHPLPTPSGVPREPTEAMREVGYQAFGRALYGDLAAKGWAEAATEVWQAMHDAALAAQGQQTGERE